MLNPVAAGHIAPQEEQLSEFLEKANELTLFGTPQEMENALKCPHVWAVEHNDKAEQTEPMTVRCVFCNVSRLLDVPQQELLLKCLSAGMQFMRWPQNSRNEAFLSPGLRIALAHAGNEITHSKADRRRARKRLRALGLEGAIDQAAGNSPQETAHREPSTPRESRVQMNEAVPEGFGPVAEVAASLGMEAKKLRKMIRDGKYTGVKVGANIFAKLKESK